MKTILLLFNIVFQVVLLIAPALKRIRPFRLLTFMILMLYSIEIFRLIYLFPLVTFISLGAGMLAVFSIAILFRQRPNHHEITATVHKIRPVNWQRNDIQSKKKNIATKKEYTVVV